MKNITPQSRIVFITGCSRGLGRAMVDEFVVRGDTVVGCARSAAAIAEMSAAYPDPHRFAAIDVTDNEALERFSCELIAALGAPDLLINNASIINANAPLWDVPSEDFSRVIDINIKGVANVIRHFVPAMLARSRADGVGGVIVNFSSGWGRSTSAEVAPYCATKWAIEGLTQALAQELPAGFAAVALNPGIIDTDMLRSCFGNEAGEFPDARTWAATAVPFIAALGAADNGKALTAP